MFVIVNGEDLKLRYVQCKGPHSKEVLSNQELMVCKKMQKSAFFQQKLPEIGKNFCKQWNRYRSGQDPDFIFLCAYVFSWSSPLVTCTNFEVPKSMVCLFLRSFAFNLMAFALSVDGLWYKTLLSVVIKSSSRAFDSEFLTYSDLEVNFSSVARLHYVWWI